MIAAIETTPSTNARRYIDNLTREHPTLPARVVITPTSYDDAAVAQFAVERLDNGQWVAVETRSTALPAAANPAPLADALLAAVAQDVSDHASVAATCDRFANWPSVTP